ncbi:hypothetical protein DR950_13795 [Kitasatospora xanthocidica]|uniref:Uncharacterized protein n=1 Tax=Kitasatospora xanthocidica TaxID=83382 RepID=A0A372ZTI8_9ACTN|nr:MULTISPECIES: hypothetical protein [Streptomycetaceae]OKI07544.1 hypothetical protein AMK13_13230 [Streptomyces sp. CB02056]RGD58710.1 hypothetical protein DR950_13795 [Kitasatospora xanthocidica]
MDAELVQEMVRSGATSVAGLMATAAWNQASSRIARLFGRGERDEEASAELEVIRAEVLEADGDEEVLADQAAALRNRLRALFRTNPQAAEELFDILREFLPGQFEKAPGGTYIINTISGSSTVNSDLVIQAGIIHDMRH